jgi:hypothetical protein
MEFLMSDIKVADGEYGSASQEISEYRKSLIANIEEYCLIMEYITSHAIKDQSISSQILRISQEVQAVVPAITSPSDSCIRYCESYVAGIDEADQYLY